MQEDRYALEWVDPSTGRFWLAGPVDVEEIELGYRALMSTFQSAAWKYVQATGRIS